MNSFIEAQHTDMVAALCVLKMNGIEGLEPALTPFGVRVKVVDGGWVMLTRQITNWRVIFAPNGVHGVPDEMAGVTRGWCYAEPYSFLSALAAAVKWSGTADTEPSGWVKDPFSERRHGEPMEGITQE